MGRLITVLLCFMLLVSTEAWAQARKPGIPPIKPQTPPNAKLGIQDGPASGTQLICNTPGANPGNFGVFVLQFMKDGTVKAVTCKGAPPGAGNPATVTEKPLRPPAINYLWQESTIKIKKWIDPNNPTDPCYEYEINGELRTICW